jgi:hypothetical protein
MIRIKNFAVLSVLTVLFTCGCTKTDIVITQQIPAKFNIPALEKNSFTSIVATRKDRGAEVALGYLDLIYFYKERDYYVYPDSFEVYLSEGDTNRWTRVMVLDTSIIGKKFKLEGLRNDSLYFVYVKEVYKNEGVKKNSNLAMFVPSSFNPEYKALLDNYYGNDLYSFDTKDLNGPIVYSTTFYEYKPGHASGAVFLVLADSSPRLINYNSWYPNLRNDSRQVVFSYDGYSVVPGFRPEHLMTYDLRTGSKKFITSGTSVDRFPCWSPDNSQIAYSTSTVSDNELRIALIDPVSLNKLMAVSGFEQAGNILKYSETNPVWSPDSKYIYYTYWTATDQNLNPGVTDIYRVSVNDGRAEPFIFSSKLELLPAVSPDNTKLAFLSDYSGKFEIWFYDLTNGRLKQLFDNDSFNFDEVWAGLKWKDNKTLLFSDRKSLWSVSTE